MRSFEEIIKDCLENREHSSFKKYYKELLQTNEIRWITKILLKKNEDLKSYCSIEDLIIESIGDVIINAKKENFKKYEGLKYFLTAVKITTSKKCKKNIPEEVRNQIEKTRQINKYRKEHPEVKNLEDSEIENLLNIKSIVSTDASILDSNKTLLDEIASHAPTPEEEADKNFEYENVEKISNALKNIGIEDEWSKFVIYNICYGDCYFKNRDDMMKKLEECTKDNKVIKILYKHINRVDKLIKECYKKDSKNIGAKIDARFEPSVYAGLINYLIEIVKDDEKSENNDETEGKIKVSKIQLKKLIVDFNKVRDYMSILKNDDVKTKKEVLKKCYWKKANSYEKETRRILDLFQPKGDIFTDFAKEKYKPNEIAKIYDIHTVPNLVINFMILDVFQRLQMQKPEDKSIKISDLTKELFQKNKKFSNNHIKTFRKYTLLPRIKEMEEYGFIFTDNDHKDRYILKAKFLKDEQKSALKYVVPFFCGLYPFASIGHFLANRLDITDKFKIEPCNVSNILDDCLTYNLLEAINNKKSVKIVLKGKKKPIEIKPAELFIENGEKNLLKVKDSRNEYYLYEIGGFVREKNEGSPDFDKKYSIDSPIFSEIYGFYYKIFEDAIKIYKECHNENKVYEKILATYGGTYNLILEKRDLTDLFMQPRANILQIMANIENVENISIPMTTLELRWLKTIMHDPRFDLFVQDEMKLNLEELVKDVEIFDLSAFKIFDYETKRYSNIVNKKLIQEINSIDKKKFKDKFDRLNSYSLINHSFK